MTGFRARQFAKCLEATAPAVAERQAYAVADHILAPTLDRMEADLAAFRARVDAAIGGRS